MPNLESIKPITWSNLQNKLFWRLILDFAKKILEKHAMSDIRFIVIHFQIIKNQRIWNNTVTAC